MSIRTGGKENYPLDGFTNTARDLLDSVASVLRENAQKVADNLIHQLPGFSMDDKGTLTLDEPVNDGIVYEIAFDGTDSDAEILEKSTGLTLLGEADEPFSNPVPCAITGKLTTRRQHIARMY